jgi:hypothetical protein
MAIQALSDHFRYFFSRLNPGASFESQASSHYNSIKQLIEDRNGRAQQLEPVCFLQGSYRHVVRKYYIRAIRWTRYGFHL